jgi:hypothetical protein
MYYQNVTLSSHNETLLVLHVVMCLPESCLLAMAAHRPKHSEEQSQAGSSSSQHQSAHSVEFPSLQKNITTKQISSRKPKYVHSRKCIPAGINHSRSRGNEFISAGSRSESRTAIANVLYEAVSTGFLSRYCTLHLTHTVCDQIYHSSGVAVK